MILKRERAYIVFLLGNGITYILGKKYGVGRVDLGFRVTSGCYMAVDHMREVHQEHLPEVVGGVVQKAEERHLRRGCHRCLLQRLHLRIAL